MHTYAFVGAVAISHRTSSSVRRFRPTGYPRFQAARAIAMDKVIASVAWKLSSRKVNNGRRSLELENVANYVVATPPLLSALQKNIGGFPCCAHPVRIKRRATKPICKNDATPTITT